jgi:aspartyl-tRNA(Asn)/glutamyl-tRNA(Gln) amidotransferase subunit A
MIRKPMTDVKDGVSTGSFGPLANMSAAQMSNLLARRRVTAVDLLDDFLARNELINPRLNAIVAINPAAARLAAQASEVRARSGNRLSRLDGIPVTVKDNIFVAGFPATWGSRLYENYRPESDDIAIARLRSAGANLLAKTNTPEFALAAYTDNLLFGPTRNPWNLKLTPGGSSGGAVAALAAGIGALAVGTDAGGSIRRPASHTGVVGFRPSTGRIPRAFGFPALASDFQVVAPAARTVDDTYLLFRTMAGPDSRDRVSLGFKDYPLPEELESVPLSRLRIRCAFGIGNAPVDREVADQVRAAAETLAQMGHIVEEGPLPFDLEQVERIWSTLSAAGLARVVTGEASRLESVHPGSRNTVERGLGISAEHYIHAIDATLELRAQLDAFFKTTDILLTPTSASLPWAIDRPYPDQIDGRSAGPRGAALFATYVNAAGIPAISVPVTPSSAGLPIGMQLAGRFGADLTVLRLAKEFEEAAPWTARLPSLA